MTKEHGLDGMYLELVLVTDKSVYQIAKNFAEKNTKGLVKVKHGETD